MARQTKCKIDLNVLKENYVAIKQKVNTKVLVLVKANAYGHGLIPCAKAMEEAGVDYLGVAITEEAVSIRKAGLNVPVLCVGPLIRQNIEDSIKYSVEQSVSSVEDIQLINQECVKQNKKASVHVKIETGMHRTGVRVGEKLDKIINEIKKSDFVELKGVFTHFASSDEEDRTYTDIQAKEFLSAVDKIKQAGFDDIIVHCANSGGIVNYPEYYFDMVRAGIIAYGYYPSKNAKEPVSVKPVLSLETEIVAINEVKAGEKISYGGTFCATKDMRVAVLPIGYGDGYKRLNSNRGFVLINGKKANIVGRVCMDMTMVDCTDIPEASIGTKAVLIGADGNESVTADDLASWAETISYEITLAITERVPKEYV